MEHENDKTSPSPDRTRWGYVFLFLGAGIVACFQVGKAPPVLPAIREELGMSLFWAGWILSTFSIIGLFLGTFVGAVSDAVGHCRMLLLGLLALAAGSLIGALSYDPSLLLATRTFEGLGFLMIAVSAPSLIVQMTQPGDLRLALAMWSCWVPAGMAMIMLLTPAIASPFGWRGLWLINAAILAGYALVTRWRTGPAATRPTQQKISLLRLGRDILVTSTSAGPLLLAIIFATYTLQWLAVTGFLPTLLIEDYGIAPGKAAILTGLMVAINVPGNLAGGWLLHKGVRRARLVAVASLIMGISSLVIYHASIPFLVRYLACLIFSVAGGPLPASLLSGAPVHAPKTGLVATTNGLLMQGSQLGQVIGPPAVALIVSGLGGWQAAPILLTASAALGIILSFGLAFIERSRSL